MDKTLIMSDKKFYNLNNNGIILKIKVVPNSSKNEVCGLYEDMLKIKIKAPAIENQANVELIKFLSKLTSKPKSSLKILNGNTAKTKNLFIADMSIAELKIFCDKINLNQ